VENTDETYQRALEGAATMTITINASPRERRDNRTDELTEVELSKVSGGSQSSGAGAGKVKFNPFSITRKIDAASP
jgi:type VI protein secretion system component Hcp